MNINIQHIMIYFLVEKIMGRGGTQLEAGH